MCSQLHEPSVVPGVAAAAGAGNARHQIGKLGGSESAGSDSAGYFLAALGVAHGQDRASKTQLLGLVRAGFRNAVVVMPGTHSKWARLADGVLADYRTFMTGELFALLKEKSVLVAALEGAGPVDPAIAGFAGGVRAALDAPEMTANALFSLRADWLVHGRAPDEGLARLSGLLIGLEIAGGSRLYGGTDTVVLLADGAMGALYARALGIAGLEIDRVEADELARDGLFMAARHAFGGIAR